MNLSFLKFTVYFCIISGISAFSQPTLHFKIDPRCIDTIYVEIFNQDTSLQNYDKNTAIKEINLNPSHSSALYHCPNSYPKVIKIYSASYKDAIYLSLDQKMLTDTVTLYNLNGITSLSYKGAIERIEYLKIRGDQKKLKVKSKSPSTIESDTQSIYTFQYNGNDTSLLLLPTFIPNQINSGCSYKNHRWYNLRSKLLGRKPKNYTSISYIYLEGNYYWSNEKMLE